MIAADVVVYPGTGEVLEHLDQQPPETLAAAYHAIQASQDQYKRWGDDIAAELRRRLKLRGNKIVVFGDWEIQAPITRSAEWDAVELEAALEQLVAEGVVRAADVADVVTHPAVVSKSKAAHLVARLTGPAEERVAALRTWKEKPGKLTVARSVDLHDAIAPAVHQTPPPEAGGRVPSSAAGPARPITPLNPSELFS